MNLMNLINRLCFFFSVIYLFLVLYHIKNILPIFKLIYYIDSCINYVCRKKYITNVENQVLDVFPFSIGKGTRGDQGGGEIRGKIPTLPTVAQNPNAHLSSTLFQYFCT